MAVADFYAYVHALAHVVTIAYFCTVMKLSGWKISGIIMVGMAVIFCYAVAITLLNMTLVNPVWIVGVSALLAGLTGLILVRKWSVLTGTRNVAVNAICQLISFTGLFMALILGVNYFCRDKSDSETVRVEITRIYSETHHRMKRVARNRYTRGEPYRMYYMDVRLPDGRKRKRSISLQRYNRYARSSHMRQARPDSVNLTLTSGALGMTILER